MATHQQIQESREALYQWLRNSCLNGTLAPGAMLPTVRELSERHTVTVHAVHQVVQRLCDEGMVYTVPRLGAFVMQAPTERVAPYLMVLPPHESSVEHYMLQTQVGFEDHIAQLGEHSVIATPDEARVYLECQEVSPLAGAFESLESIIHGHRIFADAKIPTAAFGRLENFGGAVDCVSFDDEDGGIRATRHLWQNGHRKIAFLGFHARQVTGPLSWSIRREQGWRQTLQQMGVDPDELLFQPRHSLGYSSQEQILAGQEAAEGLIGRHDISAVIATNALVAEGMFEAFREAKWPVSQWPAIVCFDCIPGTSRSVVSYLRLPWEDIGRAVAQLLWERRTGRLTGDPVQRLVPMRLIPRLSCRPDWATHNHCWAPPVNQYAFSGK